MQKRYYFMAGLPRSGSTLLSSLLNQNPNICSGPSSPVLSTMFALESHLAQDELFMGYPKPEQAKNMIGSVIDQFYADVDKPVVIDKNRAWASRIPYIEGYIGQKAKIICPVRDVEEIFTSIITMIRRNPYQEGNPRINFVDEQLIKNNIPLNDLNRCNFLISPRGILGQSLNSMKECMENETKDRLHIVEYKDLVSKPQETMNKLYEFLGEEKFEHDFQNVKNVHRERDLLTYGLADMHEVRSEVKNTAPSPEKVLPKEVLDKCAGVDFWRRAII
jgi:sulfotransferase